MKYIKNSNEYIIINEYYKNKKAKRSEVPYINHINEGLEILEYIKADEFTKKAYCLHPIFQNPEGLKYVMQNKIYNKIDPFTLMLAMEYRNKANAFLCREKTDHYKIDDLPHMVFKEVSDMLIADKIQNYKDFLMYHKDTHPRKEKLDNYFNLWIKHLKAENIWNKFK
jgi:hypothetical protein